MGGFFTQQPSDYIPDKFRSLLEGEHKVDDRSRNFDGFHDQHDAYRAEMKREHDVDYLGDYEHFTTEVLCMAWDGRQWVQMGEPKWRPKAKPKPSDLGLLSDTVRINVAELRAKLESIREPNQAVRNLLGFLSVIAVPEYDLPAEQIVALDVDLSSLAPKQMSLIDEAGEMDVTAQRVRRERDEAEGGRRELAQPALTPQAPPSVVSDSP